MKDLDKEVPPIDSMKTELNQLIGFYEDLELLFKVVGEEYIEDFIFLRDATNQLRSDYSTVYSRILVKHEDLKKLVE